MKYGKEKGEWLTTDWLTLLIMTLFVEQQTLDQDLISIEKAQEKYTILRSKKEQFWIDFIVLIWFKVPYFTFWCP